MSTPFDKATSSIPVTVVVTPGAEKYVAEPSHIIRLEPPLHDHAQGYECVACAGRTDIRAMLFDLLTASRSEHRVLSSVVIDATALGDARPVIDRLDPHAPAVGLRDHTVVRSFHLSRVI